MSVELRSATTPPAELEPTVFADRLYSSLEQLARVDGSYGWSLLILCNAIAAMFELVEELVRDTVDGPGWSVLMDAERCPAVALPWLGQFDGVRLPAAATEQEQRDLIQAALGFRRGTADSMIGAAKRTLTGQQRLIFRERDGAAHGDPTAPDYAYYLTVWSYLNETPNPAATLDALLSQKPGGIVMTYTAQAMQDYQLVKDMHANYGVVRSSYIDYSALALNQPT